MKRKQSPTEEEQSGERTSSTQRIVNQLHEMPLASTSHRRPIGLDIEDSDLVLRILDGDEWAKEAFYRKHVERAHRIALRLVRNASDAEDVVQDAFIQAYRDLPSLRAPNSVRGWLSRIVVNRAHRRFRRRAMLRALGLDKSDEVGLEHQATNHISGEARAELALANQVLNRVPLACRTAWVLRHVEGYTLPETALATDCSLATAKRRIARASAELEKHLKPSVEVSYGR